MSNKTLLESFLPDVTDSLARIEQKLGTDAAQNQFIPQDPVFATTRVQPPSQFYFTQGMQIRCRAYSFVTDEQLTITANILIDNRLTPISITGAQFTNTTNLTVLQPNVTGFLISCSVTNATATLRGQTYFVLEVLDQTGNYLFTLLSNYVTLYEPVAYPPISINAGFSGNGWWTFNNGVRIANNFMLWTVNAPAGAFLHSVTFQYITDANVADRYIDFKISVTGGASYYKRIPTPLIASKTYIITLSTEGNDTPYTVPATFLNLNVSIPKLFLPGGGSYQVQIANVQIADDFGGANQSVIEKFYTY
jgi:hypothetical protein